MHQASNHNTDPERAANDMAFAEVIETGPFPIRFPEELGLGQDEEWCEVQWDDEWHRIRFHDYDKLYKIPGLYETVFYRTLRCNSPFKVTELLGQVLADEQVDPAELRVLDLGAGNGMVGEMLQNLGTRHIVGVDIIREAKEATERDRPWVYTDYRVTDMADLDDEERQRLDTADFNALTTVAALGFADIPPAAFIESFNLIDTGGWVAFNIKEEFWKSQAEGTFGGLVNAMLRDGVIVMEAYRRYCHRLSVVGEPLHYVIVIARKNRDVPAVAPPIMH